MRATLRSLTRNRTRSLLTLSGVAVAVAAMISLQSVGRGAIRMFLQLMTRSADLLVYQRKAADLVLSSVPEDYCTRILAASGVASASGVVLAPVSVEGADVFTVLGVAADSENLRQLPVIAGRAFRTDERSVMMLGAIAAEVLQKGVGDQIQVYESSYQVVGIYRSDVGFQDAGAVVPLADGQGIVEKQGKVSVIHVRLTRGSDLGEVQGRLAKELPDMRVLRTSEFKDQYLQFQAIQFFADAVSLIAFLLGGFGVINTFLMAVRERTQEFGLLRALGWEPGRILRLVLGEVTLLCLLGYVLGAGLAIGGLELTRKVPAYTQYVQGGYPPELLLGVLLATFLLALASGAYPAWRASRVEPIVALKGAE